MMDLTEFEKSKMKEWEEFGKQYPFSWIQEFKDSWLYLFCFLVGCVRDPKLAPKGIRSGVT